MPVLHTRLWWYPGELIVPIGQLCRDAALEKVRKVIVGGATRSHSVLAGLGSSPRTRSWLPSTTGPGPLVSQAVLEAVIRRPRSAARAAPAVPVKDTIKRARDGLVTATLDRAELRAVQTPQVFQVDLIKTALQKALEDGAGAHRRLRRGGPAGASAWP